MAYDEELANRIRELVAHEQGLTEQKMFGGLAFLINGNMSVSASSQGGLLLRVDPAETDALADRPHVAAVRDARAADAGLAAGRRRGSPDQARASALGHPRGRVRALAAPK